MMMGMKSTEEGLEYLRNDPLLRDLFIRSDTNYGIFIAIAAAIIISYVLKNTTFGYSLKAVGSNKFAAEFAGINVKRNIFLSMAIAGAISGLAGAVHIIGAEPHRISTLAMSENFGFNGLAVALIANISPIGCIFAGLLFGGLKYGSSFIQLQLGAPSEIINIVIGVIVFFISMKALFTIIADQLKKRGASK
jgi:simple sugar transport system permease protein